MADSKRKHGKVFAWLVVIGIVALVGLPTALLFGLGDLIFDGPKEGVISFFGTLGFIAVLLAIGFVWEQVKERRNRGR